MIFYTGVGSRRTPDAVLDQMTEMAQWFAALGLTLRSGRALGADSAFEDGAGDDSHIYTGWPDGQRVRLSRPSLNAYSMVRLIHPAWHKLSNGARALHARNCHQVLGDDLKTPSEFLVCWTPDGCEDESSRTRDTGGTATAIVLAYRNQIPVFNLQKPGRLELAYDAGEQAARSILI